MSESPPVRPDSPPFRVLDFYGYLDTLETSANDCLSQIIPLQQTLCDITEKCHKANLPEYAKAARLLRDKVNQAGLELRTVRDTATQYKETGV